MTTVRKFAVGVATATLVASIATPAFAATGGEQPYPLKGSYDRIASDRPNNDRVDTAIAVAEVAFEDRTKAKAVYIANSRALIDAATAGQLTDGPVLLVDNNPRTLDIVKDKIATFTSAKTVYAIGGTSVVSDDVLKSVAGSKATARLGGEDRYATAIAVAKRVVEVDPVKAKTVLVSTGNNPIDALAAGTLDLGPMFYVKNGELPEEVKTWIKDNHVETVYGIGGTAVVPDKALSDALVSEIKVNPQDIDEETVKLWDAFRTARALYLGVNKFSETDPFKALPQVASAHNPSLTNADVIAGAGRFEGYKALNEETQDRKKVVDTSVQYWKDQIATAIADAARNNADTIPALLGVSVGNTNGFTGTTAAGATSGKIYQALAALYGAPNNASPADTVLNTIGISKSGDNVTTVPNTLKNYFILEKDANQVEHITGVNYSAIENTQLFKNQVASDNNRIKTYFNTPAQEAVLSEAAANATINASLPAVASGKLWDNATKTTEALKASAIPERVYQIDVNLFAETAASNAQITKTQMDEAYAKITTKQGYIRLGGDDRYATAAYISQYERTKLGKAITAIYLANGETMVDALVAGTLQQGPILLVNSAGTLTDATKAELHQLGKFRSVRDINSLEPPYGTKGKMPTVYAIGGTIAVADKTAAAAAAEVKAGNDSIPGQTTTSAVTLTNDVLAVTARSTTAQTTVKLNGTVISGTPDVRPVVDYSTDTLAPTVIAASSGVINVTLGSQTGQHESKQYQYVISVPGSSDTTLLTVNKNVLEFTTLTGPVTSNVDVTTSGATDFGSTLEASDATGTVSGVTFAIGTPSGGVLEDNVTASISGGKIQLTATAVKSNEVAQDVAGTITATKDGYAVKSFPVAFKYTNKRTS